jgi:hypothetical protein
LEALAMEDFGILYGHFVYFTAKLYILCPFGTFCGSSVYIFHVFGMLCRKNLATSLKMRTGTSVVVFERHTPEKMANVFDLKCSVLGKN